ncbi:MAG: LamG-like jellyroll fold domain-containing protein [Bacteroidota bacterium]
MRYTLAFWFMFVAFGLLAQVDRSLVAHYSFDNCDDVDSSKIVDVSGIGSDGVLSGVPLCDCGVVGNALSLNGFQDRGILLGTVNNHFEKEDFSVSLYFKLASAQGTQTILSKKDVCSSEHAFSLQVNPASNTLRLEMIENSSKQASLSTSLDFGACWHHVVIARSGNTTLLYLNGTLRERISAVSRVDIENPRVLTIGGDPCVLNNESPFNGLIDELRVYDRAITPNEVEELYVAPDMILNRDTTIFLGSSLNIQTSNTCANEFLWTPTDFLSDETVRDPIITPEESAVYNLSFVDNVCVANDSIRITVIDPDDLDCRQIFLPKAFTPNNDNLNDRYGISNPFAISDLISFEIFDRWGSRVFFTDDPMETWDGSFRGEPLNPGVLLYRVRFRCDGNEETAVGSLAIIR